MHRLVATHDVAVGDDAPEGADDVGLDGKIHREIRPAPVADHAKADEVLALPLDLRARVFAAGLAEFRGLDLNPRLADFFLDRMLDGQAVTIPARHIGRIVTAESPGFDDDVLENLVDRMADVDVAVGIGRSVMQNIFRPAAPLLAQLAVEIDFLPMLQDLRLARCKAGLHGEIRLREIQRVLIVNGHSDSAKSNSV